MRVLCGCGASLRLSGLHRLYLWLVCRPRATDRLAIGLAIRASDATHPCGVHACWYVGRQCGMRGVAFLRATGVTRVSVLVWWLTHCLAAALFLMHTCSCDLPAGCPGIVPSGKFGTASACGPCVMRLPAVRVVLFLCFRCMHGLRLEPAAMLASQPVWQAGATLGVIAGGSLVCCDGHGWPPGEPVQVAIEYDGEWLSCVLRFNVLHSSVMHSARKWATGRAGGVGARCI